MAIKAGSITVISNAKKRIASLDIVRGIVMVIMALDHVRYYFHETSYLSPTNLATTTPILFFTRWITHFCSPTFVMLAGISAFLTSQRLNVGNSGISGNSQSFSRYLFTRGIWLVLVDTILIRYGAGLNSGYTLTGLQVVWAMGWGMVILSAMTKINYKWIGALGLFILLFHNLLDGIRASEWNSEWFEFIFDVFLNKGEFMPVQGHVIFAAFPIIPWFGLMAFGYALGAVLKQYEIRAKITFPLGLAMTVAFVLLRGFHLYGEPTTWQHYPDSWTMSLLSFLNCTKNPPSLQFLLMIVGPTLMLWALLDKLDRFPRMGKTLNWLSIFGQVPLFYYIIHIWLIHYTAIGLAYIRWEGIACVPRPNGHECNPGFTLFETYFVWIAVILMLYPVCRAYARIKREEPTWWMTYL